MADRPILFSTPMVRALLEGRKTMTRRGLKPQPMLGQSASLYSTAHVDWQVRGKYGAVISNERLRYASGDRLWVREAWHAARSLDATPPRDITRDSDIEHAATARSYAEIGLKGRLRPGIHMPRWASRMTLIVETVKVERLQGISEADAIAEGAPEAQARMYPELGTCRDWFRDLWESINGAGSWDANPFVAAYSFGVVDANIDQVRHDPR